MKISIVIPVYNAEPYIKQCISSLLSQTLQDFEIICVNDRTPDNSVELIKEFRDTRITVVDNTSDKGAGAARNFGMKFAKGDYISVLDADDFFEPQMLETLYNNATTEEADVVVCGYCIYNDKTKKKWGNIIPHLIGAGTPDDFGNELLSMQSPNAWTKLYKASFIRKYNLQFDNVPYCNDMAFVYSSLFCASKIVTIPDVLINYRYFTKTQASSNKPQDLSLLIRSLLTTKDKLIEQGLYKKYEKIFIEGIRSRFQHEIHAGMTSNKKNAVLSLKNILPKDIFSKMFDTKTAVSLIVPVYNVEPFLKECLESLINQTLKNIEIICVNDGSTDGSLSILEEYAKKDKRIKVINQENKGLPVARREATKIAKGEYLQFVDSDDYIDLDACEALYTYAKLYNSDMLSFTAIDFNNETRIETRTPYHSLVWVPKYINPVFNWKDIKPYLTSYAGTACLTIYRRKFLEDNKIEWVDKR
ncbi:MAG: glycosyltransferase family 2 protein, partial [Candidatus Riflebacteria bacterium]|nr:glycosyltransferase family 2 protein [Candidatus Riflebacteria bacterium]